MGEECLLLAKRESVEGWAFMSLLDNLENKKQNCF